MVVIGEKSTRVDRRMNGDERGNFNGRKSTSKFGPLCGAGEFENGLP